MSHHDDVQATLEPLRETLKLDGADLEFTALDSGELSLRLLLEDAGCADCVMPRPILEEMVLSLMTQEGAAVTAVTIDDPRLGDGA